MVFSLPAAYKIHGESSNSVHYKCLLNLHLRWFNEALCQTVLVNDFHNKPNAMLLRMEQ